jgi:hypothetical protein
VTLPRKGSRRIVVDGTEYHWTVAPNDEPGVAIVVELASGAGRRLVSWVDHGVIVAPRLVFAAVRDALGAGWAPAARGPDFVRRVPELSANVGAHQQCPVCDYFSLPKRADHDICPVCSWEDDGLDIDQLDRHSGPNHITLREARATFQRLGACDAASVPSAPGQDPRSYLPRAPRET